MSNTPTDTSALDMAATILADAWETERDLAMSDPEFELTPRNTWTVENLMDEVSSQATSYYEDGIRTSDDAYGLAYLLTVLECRDAIAASWALVMATAHATYAMYQREDDES